MSAEKDLAQVAGEIEFYADAMERLVSAWCRYLAAQTLEYGSIVFEQELKKLKEKVVSNPILEQQLSGINKLAEQHAKMAIDGSRNLSRTNQQATNIQQPEWPEEYSDQPLVATPEQLLKELTATCNTWRRIAQDAAEALKVVRSSGLWSTLDRSTRGLIIGVIEDATPKPETSTDEA